MSPGGGDPAVFVYGTLLPGQPRWPVLAPHAREVVPATAAGRLWDTGRGYPGAVFDGAGPGDLVPGARVVVGAQAWADLVARLDAIEAEGVLFARLVVATSAGPATSYAWLGPTAGLRPLPHGWPGRADRSSPSG